MFDLFKMNYIDNVYFDITILSLIIIVISFNMHTMQKRIKQLSDNNRATMDCVEMLLTVLKDHFKDSTLNNKIRKDD